MVSSRSPGVNVSSANSTAATSRVVVSDSDVARDGDAISTTDRQSHRATDEGGSRVVNGATTPIEWSESGPPSLSMSVDLHNLVNPSHHQDSGHYSASPERIDAVAATAAASSCNAIEVRGHDEEESYEAFGSVEGDVDDGVDSPGGSSSAPSPTGTNSLRNPRSPNSTLVRHSRLRTSLRRTPPCSGRKRLSSNALASQLYRSGSFNSSGRGSICDPADDMYSDVSLEDDVIHLNHKPAKRKQDAKQNYPAEFLLYRDSTPTTEERHYTFCDGCDHRRPVLPMDRTPTRHTSPNREREICRDSDGVIEISENRVSVATDISGTTMDGMTRTIAT